jgi:hypothetical protein
VTIPGCLAVLAALCSSLGARELAEAAVAEGLAQQTSAVRDKSGYNLFNPVPKDLMRELAADRPDKTDCPFTVDAGHFQVEMDFANFTYDEPNGSNLRIRAVEVAPMNLKVGLLNNLDFQLVFASYRWERTEDQNRGTVERKTGFAGLTPRMKFNVIGNDGGFFAVGFIPFVKASLSEDHLEKSGVEGGVGIPYAFDLQNWELGLQTTFRVNRNESGAHHHAEFDDSVSVGHVIIGKLSGYVEFFSNVSTDEGSGWIGTVDTWLTYQLSENIRLDGGVYIGITSAADDWHPWLGMTWRF